MEENKPSYEDIFLRYYPPLTAFAFSFIKDEDAAKDIVQSVFIKIFEKKDTLHVHQSLKSYLYKAVSNACINHRKKEAVRSHHNASYAKELIESSFEDAVEQAEEDYKVYDAIKKLPPQCQKIFVMSRLDNRKNQEIADELSISIRTVETQISNALRTLKKAIRTILL